MSDTPATPATPAEPQRIDPPRLRLTSDPRGRLVARDGDDGTPVEGVSLARCFPWSCRGGYLSVRNTDGQELSLVRDLAALDPVTRQRIDEELAAQEFLPRITAVLAVDNRFDVMAWRVTTDRGPIELQVEHGEDVRLAGERRVLIKDHSGGLFEVPDFAALDPRSRKLVEDHLT